MIDVNKLSEALSLMQKALLLLDNSNAPAQLGAHLDLAICRLQGELDLSSDSRSNDAQKFVHQR